MVSHAESSPPLRSISALDPRWLAFVESESAATPFHHPAWCRLIERCYGYRTFVLAEVDDGSVRAGLPVAEVPSFPRGRRWVSLPFVDHCAPLGSFRDASTLPGRLTAVRAAAGISDLEVRSALEGPHVHQQSGWVDHVLPLASDPDAQFELLHRMTRRNVRVAERSALVLRQGEDVEALTRDFFGLHVQTRRRLGVPVQPKRFFRLLWEELVTNDLGYVLVVYAGSRPVAAAVFLTLNGVVVYKFGASDPEAWRDRPNNLLFWGAIKRAIAAGGRSFDFGRSELRQQGLRAFKAGWGADEEPLVYSYVAERPPPIDSWQSSTLVAGAIRRSPAWIPRLLGELFYRYAG